MVHLFIGDPYEAILSNVLKVKDSKTIHIRPRCFSQNR